MGILNYMMKALRGTGHTSLPTQLGNPLRSGSHLRDSFSSASLTPEKQVFLKAIRQGQPRSHVNSLAGKMGWPCHIPGGLASGDGRTEDLDPQLECSCWLEPWPILSSCHTLWKGKKTGTRSTSLEDLISL